MNNDQYRTEDRTDDEVISPEAAKAGNIQLISALEKLLRSRDFKLVVAGVFQPRLTNALKKLKSEKDGIEMYRGQGEVKELEYLIAELPKTLQSLKNTIPHGTKET